MSEKELLGGLLNHHKASLEFRGGLHNDLVFDDESIEAVLYSHSSPMPTVASIYEPARELLRTLNSDSTAASSEAALQSYLRFLDDGHAVSQELFFSLINIAASLLPEWPKPLSPDMPASVGPLMERLWQYARARGEDELSYQAGARLWELYEYLKRYEDARGVLLVLEGIERNRGKLSALPGIINNFAFQFQKEQKWQDAAVHYDRAAMLARELGRKPDYANARANYWGCRFEMEGAGEIITSELLRLKDLLQEAGWQAGQRKVLVLLARIEVAMGKPQAGIPLLQQAIAIDESQNSMYLEHDRALLHRLLLK